MAKGPGGPIVGRVRLKVAPDTRGFRQKVERELAGLRDLEIGIDPDMDGFKSKVNAATRGLRAKVKTDLDTTGLRTASTAAARAASGQSVEFDADLNTRTLNRRAARAARAASGQKVYFIQEWKNRISGPAIGPKNLDIPGLKSDMKFLASQAKNLTLNPFRRSAEAARRAVAGISWGLEGAQIVTGNVTKAFSRGMVRSLKTVGRLVRTTISPLVLMGQTLRWATGGPIIERSLARALGTIRRKVIEVGAAAATRLARPFRAAWRVTVRETRAARKELGLMQGQLKEMWSGAGQVVREEAGKWGHYLGTPFRKLREHLRPVTDELGLMRGQLREMWSGAGEALRSEARTWGRTIAVPLRKIGESFRNSGAGAELQRMGQSVDGLRRRFRGLSQDMQLTGITGAARNLSNRFRTTTLQVKETVRNTRDLGGLIRGFTKAASVPFKFSTRFASDMAKTPKIASKAGQSAFKRFWSKFHQPENRIFGLTEMGWMVAAITTLFAPLSGLIGGILGVLPSIGMAAAAALGATVLGWEGIKEAAQAAAPAVDAAKETLSATFQDRLTPQFEKLGEGLRTITPDLNKVAHGLSDFSQGFVDSMTSTRGIENIQEGLGNTAELFSDLKPFATDFTAGLLEMAAAGSRSFEHLGEGLNRFGASFRETMTEMSEDGSLQAAIESTFDILGSLGTNLGRVLRAGMEELPNMTGAITGMVDSLGNALVGLMPLLSRFSTAVFSGLESVFDGIANFTPQLTELVDNIGPGLSNALSGITSFAGDALAPVMEFLQGISPGMGDALTVIGDGFRGLGEAISETNLGDFASDLGTHLGDMLSSVSEAAPRFVEDMGGMLESWKQFDQQISDSALGGLLLKEKADELATGVEAYGSAFSRWMNFGWGKMGDPLAMAEQELRSKSAVLGSTLSEVTTNLKAEMEQAAAATEIDLTPQIKALDAAKTTEEVNRIRQEAIEIIKGSSLSDSEIAMLEMQLSPDIQVDPGAAAEAGAGIGEQMGPAADTAKASLTEAFTGIGDDLGVTVSEELDGAIAEMDGAISTAAEGIGTSLGEALGGVEIPTDGLTTSIMTAFDGLSTEISTRVQEIGTTAGTELSTMFDGVTIDASGVATTLSTDLSSAISTAMTEAATTAQNSGTEIVNGLTTGLSGINTAASEALSGLPGEFETKGSEAGQSLATAIGAQEGTVSTEAGKLKSAATNAVSNIDLSASGRAVGTTFAAGIRASIDDVIAAAGELAAAARAHFPNSPAKTGPFSGAGWVDKSGIAVGRDFAKGMESQVGVVESAAASVVGAAKKQFDDFSVDPAKSLEAFQRDQILQPVLEANAKKIANWRKREADSAERLQERIADINESDSDQAKKEERIAEAREKAAERSVESRQKLLESLDRPFYEDIDRSFESYYVDGMKAVLSDGLSNAIRDTDLAGQTRDVANHAVREARKAFGDHALFDLVDYNINADHFEDALYRAIEEAGIAEVPVEFAVSNVDQLMNDLDLGDGVISRAIQQARTVDPAATDARYARQNPSEVHYHVADMEEAIRLEKARERKEMMKH